MTRPLPTCALVTAALLAGGPASAQGSLARAFPNGGQRGATLTVTFGGTEIPDPARLHVDGGGIETVEPFTKGVGRVRISADAAPGPRLVRLVGAGSATSPRPFAVGTLPEREEKEPNDTPATAERLDDLPVTLNGTLVTRPDMDLFRVSLRRGECLVVAGESRALGAPTDLVVRIRNAAGLALVTQMDSRTRDPLLGFTAPADGEYLVELSDVLNNYSNIDANYVYRVTLTKGPWLDTAFPAGVRRGAVTEVSFSGWNLDGRPGPGIVRAAVTVPADAPARLAAGAGGAPNRVLLAVGDAPEALEGAAAPLTPPVTVNGRLEVRGERDEYAFTAAAGARLALDVSARELESPLDALLTLRDAEGKTLGTSDDADRGRDPYLLWTAPAAGAYRVSVSDLAGRGGPGFFYRLTIAPPAATLRLTTPSPTVVLKAVGRVEVTVGAVGSEVGPVRLVAEGLPPGVTAAPLEVTPGRGRATDVKLALVAAPPAAPGAYPFRIRGAVGEVAATAWARWDLSSDRSGTLAQGSTDELLLVIPAP